MRKNFTVTKLINPDDMDKVGTSNWGGGSTEDGESWGSNASAPSGTTAANAAAPAAVPAATPAQAPAQPAQPAQAAQPTEHEQLVDDMLNVVRKSLDVNVLSECVKAVAGGPRRELKEMTVEQLKQLKPMYMERMGMK
jgi:hypothetical protein